MYIIAFCKGKNTCMVSIYIYIYIYTTYTTCIWYTCICMVLNIWYTCVCECNRNVKQASVLSLDNTTLYPLVTYADPGGFWFILLYLHVYDKLETDHANKGTAQMSTVFELFPIIWEHTHRTIFHNRTFWDGYIDLIANIRRYHFKEPNTQKKATVGGAPVFGNSRQCSRYDMIRYDAWYGFVSRLCQPVSMMFFMVLCLFCASTYTTFMWHRAVADSV